MPQPRGTIGAPCSRQTACVATTSSSDAREHDADRRLPVVRRVGGVERARRGVEADLALERRAQVARERLPVEPAQPAASPDSRFRSRSTVSSARFSSLQLSSSSSIASPETPIALPSSIVAT